MLRESNESIPALINSMAEIIEHSRDQMPVWISDYMPADAEELRRALVEWLRANASVFQVAGTDLGRVLAHILIGMVVGGLLSLETAASTGPGSPLSDAIAGARCASTMPFAASCLRKCGFRPSTPP